MKKMIRAMAALTLALLLSIPALAQDAEKLTLAFQLTPNGDVPPGESFEVQVSPGVVLPFCGPTEYETAEATCIGNGTVYTQSV